ncbi:hypothetical protein [Amycolatopsis sp. VC5-11]|uniref:hypothetical protein n=1 Tax=Amycolatopsis sp. VC5-11 TaxID=3120156 RepID=UPI00300AB045
MINLNGGGVDTLLKAREEIPYADTHLGRLCGPRNINDLSLILKAGFATGVDNDVFCNWSLARFVEQIGTIEEAVYRRRLGTAERLSLLLTACFRSADAPEFDGFTAAALPPIDPNLLFVTVPDVVADAEATLRRFREWAPMLLHLPVAYCVQDGAAEAGIPWDWPNLKCLFMAGSTTYKLGAEMADICREGKSRGLHIHCGRVNSKKRIRYLLGLDYVDSFDGTSYNRWRNKHLPGALKTAAATKFQLVLSPETDPAARQDRARS